MLLSTKKIYFSPHSPAAVKHLAKDESPFWVLIRVLQTSGRGYAGASRLLQRTIHWIPIREQPILSRERSRQWITHISIVGLLKSLHLGQNSSYEQSVQLSHHAQTQEWNLPPEVSFPIMKSRPLTGKIMSSTGRTPAVKQEPFLPSEFSIWLVYACMHELVYTSCSLLYHKPYCLQLKEKNRPPEPYQLI